MDTRLWIDHRNKHKKQALEENKFYMGESMKQPADGISHIDMLIKILSPCVVLIGQDDNESSIMHE